MTNGLFELKYLDIRQDGFISLDAHWNIMFINKVAVSFITSLEKQELFGKCLWEAIPGLAGSEFETACRGVMTDKIVRRVQVKGLKTGRYFNNIIFPAANGISIYTQDITKDKLTEEALRQSEHQLKLLVENLNGTDQSKTAFIATLSHELRNPMASIMLAVSLMRQEPQTGTIAEKALEIIERQSAQLDNMLNDLLDVTRITRNKIRLNRSRTELNSFLLRILEDYEVRLSAKDIDLEIEYSGSPLYLNLDMTRFNQVISNLLENSLKFTESGGKIIFSVREDDSKTRVVITLKDTGIGVKPEIQKQLFKPFVQADLSLDRSHGGLGLGLVIAKGIVEMHGGEIHLFSEGIGRGTEIEISLPLQEEPELISDDNTTETRGDLLPSLDILVIDDVPDLTEILSAVISSLGHRVFVENDGAAGISLAKAKHPDVLICDIGLPGMNGYEIAEAFRKDTELRDTFLIALSGYAQPEDLEHSKQAGFHIHLSKPVNLDALKAALAEAFYFTNKA